MVNETANAVNVSNTYQPKACVGYYKMTVTGSATPVVSIGASNIPANANYAVFTVEGSTTSGNVLRCTFNASTVISSTVGVPKSDASSWDTNLRYNILNFTAISLTSSNEIIHIEFYE
jgi:hypothetical protein